MHPIAPLARLLAAAALGIAPQVQALQLLEASDGVSVEAIVSIHEPTRLRIEGAAITDVFGNIHSSHCEPTAPGSAMAAPPSALAPASVPGAGLAAPGNPAGDVVIACDRDKGEVYLRPVGDSLRPINLFVSSATATYTLLLRRADTPADTIVIRDRTPRAQRRTLADPSPAGPAPNHVRAMKALLVAMASGRIPADVHVQDLQRPLRLWEQTRFTLLQRYEGRGLVGEKYALRNVGTAPVTLTERAFDRPPGAAQGAIAGIAIEHHNLAPGEHTNIFVLTLGDAR